MAATIDREVSNIIRQSADGDDTHDYVKCKIEVASRTLGIRLPEAEWAAIEERGTAHQIAVEIDQTQARYIQRRCDALAGRGSLPQERVKEIRNPRAYRASAVVCKGWFVSPDAKTVQGCWEMVHWFGKSATIKMRFYSSNERQYDMKAMA